MAQATAIETVGYVRQLFSQDSQRIVFISRQVQHPPLRVTSLSPKTTANFLHPSPSIPPPHPPSPSLFSIRRQSHTPKSARSAHGIKMPTTSPTFQSPRFLHAHAIQPVDPPSPPCRCSPPPTRKACGKRAWGDLRLTNTQRDEVRRRRPHLNRPPSRSDPTSSTRSRRRPSGKVVCREAVVSFVLHPAAC